MFTSFEFDIKVYITAHILVDMSPIFRVIIFVLGRALIPKAKSHSVFKSKLEGYEVIEL